MTERRKEKKKRRMRKIVKDLDSAYRDIWPPSFLLLLFARLCTQRKRRDGSSKCVLGTTMPELGSQCCLDLLFLSPSILPSSPPLDVRHLNIALPFN
jgi:hypothetical protein